MNNAIILFINEWNNEIINLYNELSSQKDVFIIADNYDKFDYPEYVLRSDPKSNIPMDNKNIFFPIFAYINKIKQYDNIWVINQNIRFNGDWKYFFEQTESCDLLISRYKHYLHCTEYKWWPINPELESIYKNVSKKSLNDFSKNDWVKGDFEIFKISRKLLNFLYREMPKYVDYYECLVPTLARKFGFDIKNLNKLNLISDNMEVNKLFKYNMNNQEIKNQDDINSLYNEIINSNQFTINVFIKSQYYNYLNKCSIKNQPIHDEVINDLKNHKVSEDDFYNEIITLLEIDDIIGLSKYIFDKYLIVKNIPNVGSYLHYITRYIKKFGKTEQIIKICENFLQNQIYKLTAIQKTYIKNDLLYLHEQKVCVRFTDRILHEIQGLPIMNTQYKSISDDKAVKLLTLIDGKINFKYYPF